MDPPVIMAPVPSHHHAVPFLFENPQFIFYPSYPPQPPPRPKRALSPSQHLPPAKKRKLRPAPTSNLRPSCLSAPSVSPEVSKGFGLLTPLGSSRRPLSIVFAQQNMVNGMGVPRNGLMALRKAAILNRIKREQVAARQLQQRQVEIARRQYRERLQLARRNPKRKVKKERTEEEKRVLRQFEKLDKDEDGDQGMRDADLERAEQSCESGDESASDAEMETIEDIVPVQVVPLVPVVAVPEAKQKEKRKKQPIRSRKKAAAVSIVSRLAAPKSTTADLKAVPIPAPVMELQLPKRSTRSRSSTPQTAQTSTQSTKSRSTKRNKSPEPPVLPSQPELSASSERGRRRTRSQSAQPHPQHQSSLFTPQPKPINMDCPEFHSHPDAEKENHAGVVITPSPSPSPPPLTSITNSTSKRESKESPLPLNNAVRTIRREGLRSSRSMGSLRDVKENEFAPSGKGVNGVNGVMRKIGGGNGMNGENLSRKERLRTPFASCRRPPSPPNERVLERERRTRGI